MSEKTSSKSILRKETTDSQRIAESNGLNFVDFARSTVFAIYREYKLYRSKKYYRRRFPKSNVTFDVVFQNVEVSVGIYSSSNTPIQIFTPYPGIKYKISIGSYTQIGKNLCIIVSRQHTPELVSNHMHSLLLNGIENEFRSNDGLYRNYYFETYGDVEIGNDVWIGNDVSIRGGVKIGDGAVVGAGSLVLKNVEPYSVVAGIPAKKIKTRFPRETVDRLQKISFWNWDERRIEENKELFYNVDLFIDKNSNEAD